MPNKPKRICSYPGCTDLVSNGYCDKHMSNKRLYDKRRGTAYRRGYDRDWQEYRLKYLAKHPFCVECMKEEKHVAATDVDHIEPVNGQSDPLFWDEKNHQGLCHSHHSKKTAKENGGFGNANT